VSGAPDNGVPRHSCSACLELQRVDCVAIDAQLIADRSGGDAIYFAGIGQNLAQLRHRDVDHVGAVHVLLAPQRVDNSLWRHVGSGFEREQCDKAAHLAAGDGDAVARDPSELDRTENSDLHGPNLVGANSGRNGWHGIVESGSSAG
jgi:hypothetical protein